MDGRYSQDAAESILSSETSARQLRRALLGELGRVLRPHHPQVMALLFEDPERLEVVVVLGHDPAAVPVLPGSRMAVLETVFADARPVWWSEVIDLWKLLGSPGYLQLHP